MEKSEAIAHINALITEADGVRENANNFDAWRRKCRVILDRIFGDDSKHSKDMMAICYESYVPHALGDNRPAIRAFNSGLDTAKEMLRSFSWEITQFGIPIVPAIESPERTLKNVEAICGRFHQVVRQLRERHANRPTLDVSDEYDVQDLLHALLRLHFDDIRPEEWTPSYAGKSTRMDFLLKNEQLVIEVKKTRAGLDSKKVGEELLIDIAHYQAHPNCKALICFVYDPENRIVNPVGLESDLSRNGDDFTVVVVISPKV